MIVGHAVCAGKSVVVVEVLERAWVTRFPNPSFADVSSYDMMVVPGAVPPALIVGALFRQSLVKFMYHN